MSSYADKLRFLEKVDAVLSYAAEQEDPRAAVTPCRDFLQLYAKPALVYYEPLPYFRRNGAILRPGRCEILGGAVSECIGVPERLLSCLRALLDSTELESDASIMLEFFEEEERRERIPQIGLGLNGPGHVPDSFRLDNLFRFPLAELSDRWTLATRGGRIDPTPNGLSLRLKGMRVPEDPLPEADTLLATLGEGNPAGITRALAVIDGEIRREPSDLCALFNETLSECRDGLTRAGIQVESMFDPAIPPTAIRRNRLRAFWGHLFEYALWVLTPEGGIDLIADYDAPMRQVQFTLAFTRNNGAIPDTHHFPALRRAIADHGGTLRMDAPSPASRVLNVSLPDPIGATLDTWIPQWDAFSPRSQQMLRLLKSGGPTPPEDFILEGVLCEELERRLMPRFALPAVTNIAHESTACTALPGSDPARRKKALEQIAKGKTKKEVCQPQYAGEILWAYAHSDRARNAIGAENFSEPDLRALCETLLAAKTNFLAALRFVVKLT